MIAAAVLFTVGCATAPTVAPSAPYAPAAQGREEHDFLGYRLVLERDSGGIPAKAQAYGRKGEKLPTFIVPMREVTVCAPKPTKEGSSAGPQCEPITVFPEGFSFKSGDNSVCYYYSAGMYMYYPC